VHWGSLVGWGLCGPVQFVWLFGLSFLVGSGCVAYVGLGFVSAGRFCFSSCAAVFSVVACVADLGGGRKGVLCLGFFFLLSGAVHVRLGGFCFCSFDIGDCFWLWEVFGVDAWVCMWCVICICLRHYPFVPLCLGVVFKGVLFEPKFVWQPISPSLFFFHPSLLVRLAQACWLIIFCRFKKKVNIIFFYIQN